MPGTPNSRLRAAREATPSRRYPGTTMGRDELAAEVVAWVAAREPFRGPHPFDANHLGKLERGTVRRPGALIRAALCAALGTDEAGLGFSPPPESERLARTLSDQVATDVTALSATADVLARVRRLEDVTGPGDVLPIVHAQRGVATRLAQNARADVRPAAVGLISELEQYLGWLHMAPTVERWKESRQHLDRAVASALESHDYMRLSTALSFAADRYLRIGAPDAAAALNDAASRDQRVHVAQRTFNAFQKAHILVNSGSGRDVARALIEADNLTEQLPPVEELPPSGYWYTPWFFHGERAFVLDSLGDHREASRLAGEALTALPEEWVNGEWTQRRNNLEKLVERTHR
ncbi:MAG: hypothetical protein P8Z68_03440 [Kineosporiaceae bacterium]